MRRVFSNGPSKDFVFNPFMNLARNAKRLHIAAPYVTKTDQLVEIVREGKSIDLLVGLNASTKPDALRAIHGLPNLAVRYLTHRFHAKIFLFGDAAMIGSSNLTEGGLLVNREATICLDRPEDADAIEELRSLFLELWESARVLTPEKMREFTEAYNSIARFGPDPDSLIEKAVGRAEPVNINVESARRSSDRIFLEDLRCQVYEQYLPDFSEVSHILEKNQLRRTDMQDGGIASEVNRFLNWVRLTYAPGDETWQSAPLRNAVDRRLEIIRLGEEWVSTAQTKMVPDYFDRLRLARSVFGDPAEMAAASKEMLTNGLLAIHAFYEQLRFVKGGEAQLPVAFWSSNGNDVERVRKTLTYLIYGSGDFIQRLHDVLYDRHVKLGYFGIFCALELFGTVKPEVCPPMNGRMAKALRFLGFDVRGE